MNRFLKIAAGLAAAAGFVMSAGVANAQTYNDLDGSISSSTVTVGGSLTVAGNGFGAGTLVQVTFEPRNTNPSDTGTATGVISFGLLSAVPAQNAVVPPAGGCIATSNPTGVIANCTAGASGGVAAQIPLSSTLTPGQYALILTGVDSNNVERITGSTITVLAADGSTGTTGGSAGTPTVTGAAVATMTAAALAVALIGGLMFFFGRARRGATDES